MSGANTYKDRFIANFRREACQATAASMLDNGFPGSFDEAFEHAHTTEQLEAQPLTPDPEPIPRPQDVDPNLPAVAQLGLGLMAMTPAVLDTEGTPLKTFWNTAVSLDSVLTYGTADDRANRVKSAAWIIRGLIDGLGTEQHRQIIEDVLKLDITGDVAAQLQNNYSVGPETLWPLTIPSDQSPIG